jgi:hypothetical protein
MSAAVNGIDARLDKSLIDKTVNDTFDGGHIHARNTAKMVLRAFFILMYTHKRRELSGCNTINSMILKDYAVTLT